jgi:hypothetical protein
MVVVCNFKMKASLVLACVLRDFVSFTFARLALHSFEADPDIWSTVQRAFHNESFLLTFGVKAENPAALEDQFWKIAEPL